MTKYIYDKDGTRYHNMKEATVIMARCQKKRLPFGVRAEKITRQWHFTWAFPIDERSAKREGYDLTIVKGSIQIDSSYPGCPHCGGKGFVQCGACQKIGCFDGETSIYVCPFCGNSSEISIVESFDNIKGGGF
jgi:hypothetical protein